MLSDKVEGYLRRGETLTIDDYRRCLAWRERLRNRFMVAAGLAAGFVSLTSPGPAPLGLDSTGNPIYQTPSTAAGAPSFALPPLAVDCLPPGVPPVSFPGGDHRASGQAARVG